MGGTNTYLCERCPLIIELGGHTSFNGRRVTFDMTQVVCAACGTMHRLTERRGSPCQVSALPGPVRATRPVTFLGVGGDPVETIEWAREDEWVPIGPHPGGIADLAGFPCSHCGRAGRMVSLGVLMAGHTPGTPREEFCPVCGDPLWSMAVSDSL